MDGAPACRLSLVIPAYNEAAGIAETVVEADAALRRLGLSYEILVVDDGSQDGTAEAVAPSERVRLLRHETNRGYGAALRTGFEAARGERVAFTDADGQFDLGDLARLLPLTETCAIAVGCRARRHDPWLRKFYSRGYNLLVRTLLGTGVRDVDCALKVYRRDALEQLLPESTDFFVNTEMLTRARQLGLSVAEIDVAHRPRRRGESKVCWRDIPRTLRALLPFWWAQVVPFRAAGLALRMAAAACFVGAMVGLGLAGYRSGAAKEPPESPRAAPVMIVRPPQRWDWIRYCLGDVQFLGEPADTPAQR